MMARAAPVAVTGMGCITAAGRSVAETVAAIDAGRRSPLPPSLFSVESAHPVFMSALPEGGDPEDAGFAAAFAALPEPAAVNELSRTARLAVHAALEALADAGLAPADLLRSRVGNRDSLRVGVCLGTSVGASLDFFEYYRDWRAGVDAPLDAVHRYRASNPALALARLLGLSGAGPVQCVTNACSSGADAIGTAAAWIRAGLCDVALCGGADALARVTFLGFGSLRLTSPGACRPFDRNRDGLNLGEGAGVLVLERPERVGGRPVRATVLGYGTATDAHHLTAPHPEARGLRAAVDQALAQAGAEDASIAFINAHGTATPTNDATEGKFFRERFPATPFVATKGCTGHTLGAAGAVEAVLSAVHLGRGLLPASPGFREADPAIGVAPVSIPTPVCGDAALSQSLAFGGNNSVLVLGRGDSSGDRAVPDPRGQGGGPCR